MIAMILMLMLMQMLMVVVIMVSRCTKSTVPTSKYFLQHLSIVAAMLLGATLDKIVATG